jgi:hypothetical protein
MKTRLMALLLVLLLHVGGNQAVAQDLPLEVYRARLGAQDHSNSKGSPIKSAAGIIRQDRANYHKFNQRDSEDQYDLFFATRTNRDLFEKMLKKGRLSKAFRKAIISGTPLIEVSIYEARVEVVVLAEASGNQPQETWVRVGGKNATVSKVSDGCKPELYDEETERTVYVARLSSTDHFNSKGKRLNSAAAIVQQDRANYHKFKERDLDDESDSMFSDRKNRNWLGKKLKRCLSSRKLKKAIVDGMPLIRVTATTYYEDEVGYANRVFVELLSQ